MIHKYLFLLVMMDEKNNDSEKNNSDRIILSWRDYDNATGSGLISLDKVVQHYSYIHKDFRLIFASDRFIFRFYHDPVREIYAAEALSPDSSDKITFVFSSPTRLRADLELSSGKNFDTINTEYNLGIKQTKLEMIKRYLSEVPESVNNAPQEKKEITKSEFDYGGKLILTFGAKISPVYSALKEVIGLIYVTGVFHESKFFSDPRKGRYIAEFNHKNEQILRLSSPNAENLKAAVSVQGEKDIESILRKYKIK